MDVLYIHSIDSASPNQIPMGVVGLFNALSPNIRKLGLYSDEVTTEQVKTAKIIMMDMHWYYALYPVQELAARYKEINQDVMIVVGGYTATIYKEQLKKNHNIDYIICGDADKPFPMLVQHILFGNPALQEIPNIVSRKYVSKLWYCIDEREFSDMNYADFSWFPSYLEIIKNTRNECVDPSDDNIGLPYLPITRGCPYDCEFCYGSKQKTESLFKRGMVSRSAESIKRDLLAMSDNDDIHSVYICSDFTDMAPPGRYESLFDTQYNLNCSFELFNIPTIEVIDKFSRCFRNCVFKFCLYENHGEGENMVSIEKLNKVIGHISTLPNATAKAWNARSYYAYPIIGGSARKVSVLSNESWHIRVPRPELSGSDQADDYRYNEIQSRFTWYQMNYHLLSQTVAGIDGEDKKVGLEDLDHDLEVHEQERARRGCIPESIIDQSEDVDEKNEWLYTVCSNETVLYRFEPYGDSSEFVKRIANEGPSDESFYLLQSYRLNRGRGFIIPRGTQHCNIRVCVMNSIEHNAVDDKVYYIANHARENAREYIKGLQKVHQKNILKYEYPYRTLLLDSCKFASGTCPATRLKRLVIDEQGNIRPCSKGDVIGKIGSSTQEMLSVVLKESENVKERRKCRKCCARDRCPKCVYPTPLSEKEYCQEIRNNHDIVEITRLLHMLSKFNLSELYFTGACGAKVSVETNSENEMLKRHCRSFPKKAASRERLNEAARMCAIGDYRYILFIDDMTFFEIDQTLVSYVAVLQLFGAEAGIEYWKRRSGKPGGRVDITDVMRLCTHIVGDDHG